MRQRLHVKKLLRGGKLTWTIIRAKRRQPLSMTCAGAAESS